MEREILGKLVFLTQTDTTVGFVSQNSEKLTLIKQRPPHKYYIKALNSLDTLKQFTRVPSSHKRFVRRAKQTTFILPDGHSYRIIKEPQHLLLIDRLRWAYTTSANLSNHPYDENFARSHADVIIQPMHQERSPSKIVKLGHKTIQRIR